MFKKLAFCEFFQSKPALFYTDDQYHVDKIGFCVTDDYNITLGRDALNNASEIRTPLSATYLSPLKIGDIVQVSLVNYPEDDRSLGAVFGKGFGQQHYYGNQRSNVYVITSIEGNRLVLKDYFTYNHSYATVGYVGWTREESLISVLGKVSGREMRAFPSKQYTFRDVDGTLHSLPFQFNVTLSRQSNDGSEAHTQFDDDFRSTNVTPAEIIHKAVVNSTIKNAKQMYSIGEMVSHGALINSDESGFYVMEYIALNTDQNYKYSVRIKPSVEISTTPRENSSAGTVWIQPGENADDYIRAGVVAVTETDDLGGQDSNIRLVKGIKELTPSDYQGSGITSLKTILVSYNELFEGENADKAQKRIDEDLVNIEHAESASDPDYKPLAANEKPNVKDIYKTALGKPLSPETIKELLSLSLSSKNTTIPGVDLKAMLDDNKKALEPAKKTAALNVQSRIKAALTKEHTPLEVTVDADSIYLSNLYFRGVENCELWYTSNTGGTLNGINVVCTKVCYTPTSTKYTFRSTSYTDVALSVSGNTGYGD